MGTWFSAINSLKNPKYYSNTAKLILDVREGKNRRVQCWAAEQSSWVDERVQPRCRWVQSFRSALPTCAVHLVPGDARTLPTGSTLSIALLQATCARVLHSFRASPPPRVLADSRAHPAGFRTTTGICGDRLKCHIKTNVLYKESVSQLNKIYTIFKSSVYLS